jgi:hypothetical protein
MSNQRIHRTREESIAGLQRGMQYHLEQLSDLIEGLRYQRRNISQITYLDSLSSAHRRFAAVKYVIEGDLRQFKQDMHICGLCKLRSMQKIPYEQLAGFNAPHMINALKAPLLSDNIDLIRAMASLLQPETETTTYLIIERMWKVALLNDNERLKQLLPLSAGRGSRKAYRKEVEEGRDLFSLLLAGDKAGLEERIIKDIDMESMDADFDNFISIYATAEAKLCHIRGIPVEIDHPRVPMDLVRIDPLPNYDDVYDFLAPGYEPPPEGLFGHLKSWIKKI